MLIQSVHDIADRYDNFIVDVWGVLHDGRETFPFVKDTLRELKDMGKQVIFLTNSPTRAHEIQNYLEHKFDLPRDLYHDLHSSGEDAYEHMSENGAQHEPDFTNKCLAFVSGSTFTQILDDCGLESVGDLQDASFILNLHPPFNESITTQDYEALLKQAKLAGKAMVCVNPDMGVIYDNRVYPCAGSLAQFYESIGGQVYYHGKPYPSVYETVLSKFDNPDKSRTVAIGDSLRTDITGAHNFGISSILVLSGLDAHYARETNASENTAQDLDAIAQQFLQGSTIKPTYVCTEFK